MSQTAPLGAVMAASSLALTLGNISVRQLDGLFCLNDLHRAAGGEDRHQPAFFLRMDWARELRAEIENSANLQSFEKGADSHLAMKTIKAATAAPTPAASW